MMSVACMKSHKSAKHKADCDVEEECCSLAARVQTCRVHDTIQIHEFNEAGNASTGINTTSHAMMRRYINFVPTDII